MLVIIQEPGCLRRRWPCEKRFMRSFPSFSLCQMKHSSIRSWPNCRHFPAEGPQTSVICWKHPPPPFCANPGKTWVLASLGSIKCFPIKIFLDHSGHAEVSVTGSVSFNSGGKVSTDSVGYEDSRNIVHILVLSLDSVWQLQEMVGWAGMLIRQRIRNISICHLSGGGGGWRRCGWTFLHYWQRQVRDGELQVRHDHHLQHPDEPGGPGEQSCGGRAHLLSSPQIHYEHTAVSWK